MKIAFINPYCLDPRINDYDIRVPPIGLYYLAAILKEQGHECEILNWHAMKGKEIHMETELRRIHPDVTAISILHANRWGGLDIARISKRLFPETPVIFGGPGATFLWRHLLTHFPEIDVIVMGEGEKTLSELVKLMEKQEFGRLKEVLGIAYREGGMPTRTGDRPFISDLDSLPDPARFFTFQHVISSRGCPWNCGFCGSPRIWNRKVRFHGAEYFVNQLERLNKNGINFFYVSDDTFTLKKDRVVSICNKVIERRLQIEWAAISRVNIVDEEIAYWMRRAGCIQISYGVESGSPKIRRALNKTIKDEEIKKAFETTRAYGMMPRAYFIYGSPGENKKTIDESISLIKRIRPLGAIFYILDIFPGTKLYDDFKKRTGRDDDIWLNRIEDIMYFQTDKKLNEEKVLKFGKRLRNAFYSRLPDFALDVKLKNLPELAPYHASFLSRLGMTFIFGDYGKIHEIPHKERTAMALFEQALTFFPDHRAYLGLAILLQKNGKHDIAIRLLEKGLKHFPDSSDLSGCLGVSLMSLGEFDKALDQFMKHDSCEQNLRYAVQCAKYLGQKRLALTLEEKIKKLHKTQVCHSPLKNA